MAPRHPLGLALLALVAVERGVELALSRRNEARLRAMGAVEVGAGHYPVMVALHTALLAAALAEGLLAPGLPAWATRAAAAGVAAAQALRWWAISTLGVRWCTRVLVLPGAAPITGGPYRLLPHPNYLAVAVEVAALPLACGAWRTAIAFGLANGALLAVRIRAEERALGERWARAFGRVAP